FLPAHASILVARGASVQPPGLPRVAIAAGCPAAPHRPRPPGTPKAAGPAGGTMLPLSAAAPQSDCRLGYLTQRSPCATVSPAVTHAPPRCWSAPRPPLGPRSTETGLAQPSSCSIGRTRIRGPRPRSIGATVPLVGGSGVSIRPRLWRVAGGLASSRPGPHPGELNAYAGRNGP